MLIFDIVSVIFHRTHFSLIFRATGEYRFDEMMVNVD